MVSGGASVGGALPAITLWQPWASLVAAGAKPFETRHWPPPARLIGVRIAIHAARRPVPHNLDPELAAAIGEALGQRDWQRHLPRGAVLCTATLAGAYRLGAAVAPEQMGVVAAIAGSPQLAVIPIDSFGDYAPLRWAWQLTAIEPLAAPSPAKGRQGWWRCSLTASPPPHRGSG
jgi:hypothetical protein